jgi:hypothetical protein
MPVNRFWGPFRKFALIPLLVFSWPATTSYLDAQDQVQPQPLPSSVTPQELTVTKIQTPYRQIVPGLLGRKRFVSERNGPFVVEIWDLMVGPGRRTESASLSGAVVLEVRSGVGVLASGGQSRELRTGNTTTLEEKADFSLSNGDKESPLILRATVLRPLH